MKVYCACRRASLDTRSSGGCVVDTAEGYCFSELSPHEYICYECLGKCSLKLSYGQIQASGEQHSATHRRLRGRAPSVKYIQSLYTYSATKSHFIGGNLTIAYTRVDITCQLGYNCMNCTLVELRILICIRHMLVTTFISFQSICMLMAPLSLDPPPQPL